jgi:hypothetical protein
MTTSAASAAMPAQRAAVNSEKWWRQRHITESLRKLQHEGDPAPLAERDAGGGPQRPSSWLRS